jgi:cation diffusion facilitator family transporter
VKLSSEEPLPACGIAFAPLETDVLGPERATPMAAGQSKTTVIASILCTAVITVAKFVAAFATGSAAMIAEAIHSLIDTANCALLYLGMRRASRPADEDHPFGYGMELYFWTLIVALTIFAVGGCANICEGVRRILHPQELHDIAGSCTVLGVSFFFNAVTWYFAFREFSQTKGEFGYGAALRRIKDPCAITVLLEDTASLIGLVLAFLGIVLGKFLGLPVLDGIASVLIGLLLGGVAVGLVYQSKMLLIGESANREVVDSLRSLVEQDESVAEIIDLLTMHFSPEDILVNLKVRFHENIDTRQIAEAVDRLEEALRTKHPSIKRIFIEPGPVKERGHAVVPARGGHTGDAHPPGVCFDSSQR